MGCEFGGVEMAVGIKPHALVRLNRNGI
jgi:hypothetical protein